MIELHVRRDKENDGYEWKCHPKGNKASKRVCTGVENDYSVKHIPHGKPFVRDLCDDQNRRPDKNHKVGEQRPDVVLSPGQLGVLGGHGLQVLVELAHVEGCPGALGKVEGRGDPVVPKRVCDGVGEFRHTLSERLEEHHKDADGAHPVDANSTCVGLEVEHGVVFLSELHWCSIVIVVVATFPDHHRLHFHLCRVATVVVVMLLLMPLLMLLFVSHLISILGKEKKISNIEGKNIYNSLTH